MSDEVEVTPHGEIVARCINGEVWTEPDPDGISLTIEEGAADLFGVPLPASGVTTITWTTVP